MVVKYFEEEEPCSHSHHATVRMRSRTAIGLLPWLKLGLSLGSSPGLQPMTLGFHVPTSLP